MATQNANVSYKSQLTLDELRVALSGGMVPVEKSANLRHFLDEAPLALIVTRQKK